MTLAEIRDLVLRAPGEDPGAPAYYTAAEATAAINRAYRIYGLLSLAIEETLAWTWTGGNSRETPEIFRMLFPLRLTIGGKALSPHPLGWMAAANSDFRRVEGTPESYSLLFPNHFWLSPYPAADTAISLRCVVTPEELTADGDTLGAPDEDQAEIAAFAAWLLRLKEGVAEEGKNRQTVGRFFECVAERRRATVERSRREAWDSLTFGLPRDLDGPRGADLAALVKQSGLESLITSF